jgi:outer membrane protein assembly factor BamB
MRPPARFPAVGIFCAFAVALYCFLPTAYADDWPQWRGPGSDGVWKEKGILESFPSGGLKIRWRVPVGGGISSPVVARGRVYVTDSLEEKPKAWERIHCFDEKTGAPLWTHSYEARYVLEYAFQPKIKTGPYSTPIVEAGHLYALGIMGDLVCLDAASGELAWKKNLTKEYGLGDFYTTPSLLVEGNLLILVIGGQPSACVVALDKNSGEEVWRALDDRWTYSAPIVISAGGQRQLIVWTREAVTSLDPATGKTWWREKMTTDYAVVSPVFDRHRLLVNGVMFQLDPHKPAASRIWPEKLTPSRIVLTQTSLPLLLGDYVYSNRVNGHLVCLEAGTGKEVWRTDKVTDQGNAACIHLTPNGGSVLAFTDQGELIRAHLTPAGYEEISRVHLIDPTYFIYGRNIIWTPPAFANGHIFVRNDEELICASLVAGP